MSRLDKILTAIENALAMTALVLATAIAVGAVLLRFFFNVFLSWSEESIIYLIIYSTFLGAVITLRHNEHVSVDLLLVVLKGRPRQAVALLGAVLTAIYFLVVGIYAWLLLSEPFSTSTSTPSLNLPLWVVEAAVPIGFTLMFVRALEIVWRTARGRTAFKEGGSSVLESEAAAAGIDLNEAGRR
jgi:C4-dicarboxylate transporter DctQ subunit